MMFERRTASHRLICNLHMQSVAVGVGIDRDRRGCRAVAPSSDAAGDFTPVGDAQSANMVEDPGSFRGSLEPLQPDSPRIPSSPNMRKPSSLYSSWPVDSLGSVVSRSLVGITVDSFIGQA